MYLYVRTEQVQHVRSQYGKVKVPGQVKSGLYPGKKYLCTYLYLWYLLRALYATSGRPTSFDFFTVKETKKVPRWRFSWHQLLRSTRNA